MEVDIGLVLESSEKQLIELLLDSSADLPLDILETEPYPEDLTLALFSQIVYTQKQWYETDTEYREKLDLPQGWCLLATGSNSDATNGYFGAAFFHARLQQIVVAHRGTLLSNTGALITDALGICGNKYTSCANSALTFTENIRKIILYVNTQHSRCYNLAITGHSLGGWLAQITAFTVKWLIANEEYGTLTQNSSGGIHARAVVFDSPGAKDMLDKIRDNYYERLTTNFLDRLDIVVYVSAPNLINTCGMHVGTVNRVKIDVSNFDKVHKETPLYTLKTHAIDNFVNAFRNKSDIKEIIDWPTNRDELELLFGKDALNHDNCYDEDFGKQMGELYLRYETDEGMMVKCCLKAFSEKELQILNNLIIIDKHAGVRVFDEFVSGKNLQMKSEKLFPDFEINLNNQTIICKSKQLLKDLTKRVKQLMRWLGPEFMKVVEEQIDALLRVVDSFYHAETQSFIKSLPKSSVNFTDSIGLQEFLLSDRVQVLSLVTKDGAFEIIRLLNIFSQIKESVDSSHPINKYTNESHYTVVDFSRLQKLLKIDGSPINQNNLMMVDGTSSLTVCSDLLTFFNNYLQCSPTNFKKLVFISSHVIDLFDSFENIQIFIAPRQINLLDMSDESQKCLLERNLISTGNTIHSFKNLLEESCTISNINQILSSEHIKKIATIEDYLIIIKDTCPLISDLQMPYIITNVTTSKEYVLSCTDLPNSLVVISGLNRGDLETGAAWERLKGKIILAEGDAELFFKYICKMNQYKTIYLFEVSGDAGADVRCKHIFNSSFYMTRKFIHRISINFKYFTESMLADDMFVVCSEEQKTSLQEMIKERKKMKVLENVVLIATNEQEVDVIQMYSNKNIHFVKMGERDLPNERDVVEWRFSHGSVASLRRYISTDSFDPIDEPTLSLTERKLVIITDEPGMGKTTFLASLSRHIKSAWVIHIEIKQFKVYIDRLSDKLNPQTVASFILSECCTSADDDLAHCLLENLLQSKTGSKRVVLMFDGFDEMDDYTQNKESSKDKLIKVFAFLQSKPTIQIFLTSRKYLKESLETKLNQFSTSFVTINSQEQQDFLFMFWKSFLPLELGFNLEGLDMRLKDYAAEVLRRAKLVLGPDMDCFMGIPLQLRMLAEVFRPQSDLLFQSLEDLYEKINIVSAPNLYKMYVNLKYDIYLHNKTTKGRALDEDEILEYIESLTKDHGELSFRIFFPNFYDKNFEAPTDQKLVKLNRVGLIQSLGNGEFHFIHRTYAEYCCAKMVVQWINQPDSAFKHKLIKNVLLPQILLHPDSKVIRIFMNVELEEIPMLNTQPIICQLWLEDSPVFRDHEHQTALHIAMMEKNEHIIAFLINGLSLLKENSQVAYVSFFTQQDIDCHTAINVENVSNSFNIESNWSSNRVVRNIIKSIETCSNETKETFFYACLLSYKSNSYFSNYLRDGGTSLRFYNISRGNERFKMVNFAINQFIGAICDNNVKVLIEILSDLLHNNIERYCLLLKKNTDGKTGLHLAAKFGHLDVVQLLAEQTSVPFVVLMARRDNKQKTPLFTAAEYGHLDIVKFFKERGADINIRCHEGKTAIMIAATGGYVLIVEFLIKSGANINSIDNKAGTALHHAIWGCNLPVLECLVKSGADINSKDSDGNTALQYSIHVIRHMSCAHAVRMGILPVIEYLCKNGADINSKDNDGYTTLQNAIVEGNLLIIEYLVKCGADINSTDNDGNTALHNVVREYNTYNISVVEYVVKSGVDINCTNNYGWTALYMSACQGYLPIVKYLLQHNANPDKGPDWMAWTALTGASQRGKWDVMRALLEGGADVNADGGLALSYAIEGREWSIVKCLVDKQVSVHERVIYENLSEFKNKFPNFKFKTE